MPTEDAEDPDDEFWSDRNGEPSEYDVGCAMMGLIICCCAVLTALIVWVSTRS